MKVELKIILELPDKYANWSDPELSQLLFDNYTHFVTLQHATETVKWGARAKIGTDHEVLVDKLICEKHKEWWDITKNTAWTYTII